MLFKINFNLLSSTHVKNWTIFLLPFLNYFFGILYYALTPLFSMASNNAPMMAPSTTIQGSKSFKITLSIIRIQI